jgi:hypothetical protein
LTFPKEDGFVNKAESRIDGRREEADCEMSLRWRRKGSGRRRWYTSSRKEKVVVDLAKLTMRADLVRELKTINGTEFQAHLEVQIR